MSELSAGLSWPYGENALPRVEGDRDVLRAKQMRNSTFAPLEYPFRQSDGFRSTSGRMHSWIGPLKGIGRTFGSMRPT